MILVTGGTGLVGAHLLYKLAAEGKEVRAIYRNEQALEKTKNVFSCYTNNYKPLFNAIEWVKADILDLPALAEAFNEVSEVYHCAAFISFAPNDYHLLRKINIEGTANVVNIGISKNINKLCYVSSVATLGNSLGTDPINESTYWNPELDNSVYAITKYGAEMEVWRGTQEGLNAVIVNPGVIIGAGIWENGTGQLFKKAQKGIPFYSSGSIGLVAVEDVVRVMTKLMDSDTINERFILVAENWPYQKFLRVLATSVNGKIPKRQISPNALGVLWRLDWLKHAITRQKRQLTKQLARSLSSKHQYSNLKIKHALNYQFKDMVAYITSVGQLYLK